MVKEPKKPRSEKLLEKAKLEFAQLKKWVEPVKVFLDHQSQIIDTLIYAGLAYQSFKVFGVTEREVTEQVQVYHAGITGEYPASIPTFPRPLRESPEWYEHTIPFTTPSYYTTETKTHKVAEYNPVAALIGPIGLKLAQSDNIVSGAAGVSILAGLGIASIDTEAVSKAAVSTGFDVFEWLRSQGLIKQFGFLP